jgi:CRP-like cAMP-binding protein
MESPFSLPTYLQNLAYFQDLDKAVIQGLAQQTLRRTRRAGELIFLEGEPAAGLWIIESGRVKIYKLNPAGQEHVLHILGEGNTFNDIAALDGGANPANAAALSDVLLWVLPASHLHELIRSDGAFALRVVRILTTRVRILVRKVEDLALYSVVARLARFLLKQAHEPALSGPGVTRAAIAAHLATTPQTISTALRELETGGAIEFNRHQIVIVDEELLRTIALL